MKTSASLFKLAMIMFFVSFLLVIPVLSQTKDIKGSADPAIFPTRMPGFYISSYTQLEFESYAFQTGKGRETVEGRKTRIIYERDRATEDPGGLAVRRNYENAITKVGGKVVYSDGKQSILKIDTKEGEVWAEINAASIVHRYFLTIVERKPLEQVIAAEAILAALDKDGFIALYILFDFNKADIKAESQPIIDQIVSLLKQNPELKVNIEGHTDNVGSPETNKILSQSRAQAVVKAIISQAIAKERLIAIGHGEEKPIADNRTEEGRAKNRRVELVKR
ncbi:MAG: OmpA family protein [Blastocatellia bacterium]